MNRIIGARVRALRERKALTQGQLAYKAQTTSSQISRLENDERPGAQAVLIGRIATILETSIDYLLGNTDNPNPITLPDLKEGDYPPDILRMGLDLIAKWDEIERLGDMEGLVRLYEIALFQAALGVDAARLKLLNGELEEQKQRVV